LLGGAAFAAYCRLVGSISGQMRSRYQRAVAAHRVLAVGTGTAVLFGCALTFARTHQPAPVSPAELAIGAVTYIGLAAISILRWPSWLLVAVTAAGAFASMAAGFSDALITSALLVGLLVFSLRSERAPAIVATVADIGVLGAGHLLSGLHSTTGLSDLSDLSDLSIVPWLAVVAAIGQAARARRAQKSMLEERARRTEENREHEARRRIQEERLRIARELHDAVGHHVALISVQAGAMDYLLDTDPDKARESLAHIQQASESALEELRLTVGLLRQPGDPEPTEPAGKLARLGELIDSFTATGLRVTCDVTGEVRQLPEAVDLTAYRLIQESLTNTAKHAAGASASVQLAFLPGILSLVIEDDGGPNAAVTGKDMEISTDTGHGIVGMRERAAALGGRLCAGPHSGGGFRVLAELPVPAP
jgi:signal transduction histidine kinase